MMRRGKILLIILTTLCQSLMAQQTNNLASSPPLGWNSWNWFGKHEINEENMKQCMDAMVAQGLLDAGYEYFVIDGGWRDTKLGPNGELLAHPKKFPNGMKALADYAHSKGLKFGLHTVPGTHDCGGDAVGGFGNEEVHVKQFADWGLDFVKLDKCKHAGGWNEELLEKTYRKWHQLLENCERDIILSISAYTFRDWNPEVCQMSRTTLDIGAKVSGGAGFDYKEKQTNFLSVMQIAEENDQFAQYAEPGYWNDPDILVIGDHGLTFEEQKAHFALWCIMSSPLMLGNDPRSMTPGEKSIVLNELAIYVNQDPTEQGNLIKSDGKREIWAKKLAGGETAVLLLNRDSLEVQNVGLNLSEIGNSGEVNLHEIYSGKKMGTAIHTLSKDIEPRTGLFLLLQENQRR